ncbi:MAG: phosphoenolpyruvate--protein phosphotransferase [Deltaproteobacteria bacterium]|nr:phosphoenolpyruvate--protein phosphotransferase [Deltaproteobacteria bacterium]
MTQQEHRKEVSLLKGLGVSPGIVIGKAYVIDSGRGDAVQQYYVEPEAVKDEVERFKDAIKKSKVQLNDVRKLLAKEALGKEHLAIIDAHIMMINDQTLINDTVRLVKNERKNAEWALMTVLDGILRIFEGVDDKYFKERSSDIAHIVDRIIMNLSGKEYHGIASIDSPVVVIAHDISPTDTAQMVKGKVLAFLTDVGGKTSHTAIMGRALDIPAVVGLERVTRLAETGDTVIVDGSTGTVIVNPSESITAVYRKRRQRYEKYQQMLHQYNDLPAETTDGKVVSIQGNMEIVDEISSLVEHGVDGIGLYRTEFLYLDRKELPTEEEHLAAYRYVVKKLEGRPVVIRTLDVGGDKVLKHGEDFGETNPALGLRAIRFSLRHREIFKTQLRAILRASAFGKIKIMFPMISGLEELMRAKAVLNEAREELRAEGHGFDEKVEVGIMIEVPSAAAIADILAEEADFFSIGTNDLVQYSIAIDRVNEHVAYLYEPLHPAILRLIKGVVDAAKRRGIEVSVCGEMAGEPEYALLFLGMGITKLSMNAFSVLKVKKLIRSVSYGESMELTVKVFAMKTAKEIEACLVSHLADFYKEEYMM